MSFTALRQWSRSPGSPSEWSLHGLTGRLVELSGAEDSCALTFAFGLVRQAQLKDESVVWVAPATETFYPPDVASSGIDLDALAVVRVPTRALARAADQLARSGGFGLVVVDVGTARVAMAALSRLLGLAQKHKTTLLFLTDKPEKSPSLGSLISLRAQAVREQIGPDEFACKLTVIKDKRRAPGWVVREVCCGPAGLH